MNLNFANGVPTEFSFACDCGALLTVNMELPEKLTLNTGGLTFGGKPCPACGMPARAPSGTYQTIDGKLIRTGDQSDSHNQNPA